MATTTLADFVTSGTYQNIVATTPAAGSVDVEIQNIGTTDVSIVALAAAGPPASTITGIVLRPREGFTFNNAQIWVKSFGGAGKVSLTTL